MVYFRADGSANIGLGHIVRSLALADMLKTHFEIVFLVQNPSDILVEQIGVQAKLIILPETKNYIEEAHFITENYFQSNDIVVLDGYKFDTDYQKIIKNKACKLLCIDDIHAYHFVADVVINHSVGIEEKDYSYETYTKFCLGIDYALLRKPFLDVTTKERKLDKILNLFICLGGSDSLNLTKKILETCVQINDLKKIHVVVGSAYLHTKELQNFIANYSKKELTLHQNLSATEMAALMDSCELAIVPASTLILECIALKLITLVGYYAQNQVRICSLFAKEVSHIVDVGDLNNLNLAKINEVFQNAKYAYEGTNIKSFFEGSQFYKYLKLFQSL